MVSVRIMTTQIPTYLVNQTPQTSPCPTVFPTTPTRQILSTNQQQSQFELRHLNLSLILLTGQTYPNLSVRLRR